MINNDRLERDIDRYSSLLRSSFNAKLSNGDSSYNNAIGFKLQADKLILWLNEPSETILNADFKATIEQIITTVLFPAWTVLHSTSGLNLIARKNEPIESARALVFPLHYGLYKRIVVNSHEDTNLVENNQGLVGIQLMEGKNYFPSRTPHVGIMASTRSGKSTFIAYFLKNCKSYSELAVKRGAYDDHANPLIIIDPKLDANLSKFAKRENAEYIYPNFSANTNSFIETTNSTLKEVIDLMHSRADYLKNNPNVKFKDVFLAIDEALAITSGMSSKSKSAYMAQLDQLLLMSAALQIHVLVSSQSFMINQAISSFGRLQLGLRILLTKKVTKENAQYLFSDLDDKTINSLVLDQDNYGSLGIGIATEGAEVYPFKAPYINF